MNYDRTNMREDEWEADGVLYTAVEALPTACVERNLHSLRAAIDEAMRA